ncbi:MAG: DEAD/DEAH box helicase family protein [Phormidesmis sp.]
MANYHITDADDLTNGGAKTKARHNIAAIQLLKALEQEQRPATSEEQAILIRYAGWGAAADIFTTKPEWATLRAELEATLTEDEFAAARASTINAFYTSADIATEIYRGVERLGFTGGRILDPSMGATGIFEGTMPVAMAKRSQISGIELDAISGRIASQIYPDATIYVQGFQDVILPDDHFDLTISNVPFSEVGIKDPRYQGQPVNTLHDYFFAKGLDKLRPGGLLVYITSTGTMQSAKGEAFRQYLNDRANLVGAMRLPGDAFKKNAGTEVTTDLIILQKLGNGVEPNGIAWSALENTDILNSEGNPLQTNQYYAQRPALMLGELCDDKLYPGRLALKGDGRALSAAIRQAFKTMPEAIYQPQLNLTTEDDRILVPPELQTQVKQSGFTLHQGQLMVRQGDYLEPIALTGKPYERVIGLMNIRDAVQAVFNVQLQEGTDTELAAAQAQLTKTYDHFVKANGYVHSRGNRLAFREDPDYPLLLALEKYDPEEKTAQKTDIFSKRTIQAYKPRTTAENAKEGLLFSLNELGKVDIEYIAKLTSQSKPDVILELQKEQLIFRDPEKQEWQTQDEYLSGNVKQKLEIAQAAAAANSEFTLNVEALQAVQPEPLLPGDIDVRLGSVWVPAADVETFTQELLGIEKGVRISHSQSANSWYVNATASVRELKTNLDIYGTGNLEATQLIELALNLKNPTIYKPDPSDPDRRIVDQDQTAAARLKQEEIKEKFKDWVWHDPERTSRLTHRYNEIFNTNRERQYNGSHLALPGKNPNFILRKHQADAVYRSLSGNMLLAHVVGAGKTAEMICSAMEQKRLGLASKPMFVVPNHLLEQWAGEIKHLYPTANILAATKKDSAAANRQQLMSRIATGQWDAVVVTHTAFEKLQLSGSAQTQFLKEEYEKVREAILSVSKGGEESRRVMKDLERKKLSLEGRINEIANSFNKDNTITFEQLGIDLLLVDESHYFKNLGYVTKMRNIAGLPNTESKRAFDMHMKVRYMAQVRGEGKGVIFATGTPIANSMAELYTVQRYLQPKALEQMNLASFDDWASVFGETITSAELAATGKFQVKTRFSSFVNLPELMGSVRQVMDIQTADMLKLPVPKLLGNKPTVIAVPATNHQLAYMEHLVKRAENMRNVDPKDDNMLKLTGNGRSASADMRLLFPEASDEPDSKINRFINDAFEFWEAHGNQKTHLVFCDLGTPKKAGEFSLYQDIKDKLIAKGFPEKAIAFAQDYKTDAKKLQLQQHFNKGKVAILISGAQLETGFNGQRRLARISHLTVPWRPDQIEQRDGRMIRQGNENDVVESRRYVTQGRNGQPGIDGYFWQTLETKAGFISQVMKGSTDVRRMSDVSTEALNYSEIKAIATGNPLIMEKATLDNTIRQLSAQKRAHTNTHYRIRQELEQLPAKINRLADALRKTEIDRVAAQKATQEGKVVLFGQTLALDQKDDIGKRIRSKAVALHGGQGPAEEKIGRLGNFDLYIKSDGEKGVGKTYLKIDGENPYYRDNILRSKAGAYQPLGALEADLVDKSEDLSTRLADRKKDLKDLSQQANRTFQKEDELAAAIKRLAEVHEGLKVSAKSQNQGRSQHQIAPPDQHETSAASNIAKLITSLKLARDVVSPEGFYLSLQSIEGKADLIIDSDDGKRITIKTDVESDSFKTKGLTAIFQVDDAGLLALESAQAESHPETDQALLAVRLAHYVANHAYGHAAIAEPGAKSETPNVQAPVTDTKESRADNQQNSTASFSQYLTNKHQVKLSSPTKETIDKALSHQLKASLEEAQQPVDNPLLYNGKHITISKKSEQQGIEIRFADKPSKEWTQKLKSHKFRFSKKDDDPRWYAKESRLSIPLIVSLADRYEKARAISSQSPAQKESNREPIPSEPPSQKAPNNAAEEKLRPNFKRYLEHKEHYPDSIVLVKTKFKFFETYREDAALASKTLNTSLASVASRSKQYGKVSISRIFWSVADTSIAELQKIGSVVTVDEDNAATIHPKTEQVHHKSIASAKEHSELPEQNAAEFIHAAALGTTLMNEDDFSLSVENDAFNPLVIKISLEDDGARRLSLSQYAKGTQRLELTGEVSFAVDENGKLNLTDTAARSSATADIQRVDDGGDRFFAGAMVKNLINLKYAEHIRNPSTSIKQENKTLTQPQNNLIEIDKNTSQGTQLDLYTFSKEVNQAAAATNSNPGAEKINLSSERTHLTIVSSDDESTKNHQKNSNTQIIPTKLKSASRKLEPNSKDTRQVLASSVIQRAVEQKDPKLHTALASKQPAITVNIEQLRDWYAAVMRQQQQPSFTTLKDIKEKGIQAQSKGSAQLTAEEAKRMNRDINHFANVHPKTSIEDLRTWYRANLANDSNYVTAIQKLAEKAKASEHASIRLKPTDQLRMEKEVKAFQAQTITRLESSLRTTWAIATSHQLTKPHIAGTTLFPGKDYNIISSKNNVLTLVHNATESRLSISETGDVLENTLTLQHTEKAEAIMQKMSEIMTERQKPQIQI